MSKTQNQLKNFILRCTCNATLIGICLAAADGAYAQVGTINSAFISPRVFNDVPGAPLTTVSNYPTQVSFNEQNVSAATGFANRDLWQFSNNGGASAYQFQNGDYFHAAFALTLIGSPISPRKEAGFLFSTANAGDVQFIVNTDGHEVVQFGGNSFYSFSGNNIVSYNSGNTINLGLNYFLDGATGNKALQFFANGNASPVFDFAAGNGNGALDIGNGSTLGGYFQIQNSSSIPNNSGSASFQNISMTVPEPSSFALLGMGIVALGAVVSRRRRI